MYVRHRPLFKNGPRRFGQLLCFVVAIAPGLVMAQVRGAAEAPTSQPLPHRLEVRVDPPRFGLGRGQAFDEGQLLAALSTRLARWKLRVVRASEASGPGAIWRLHVRARAGARSGKRGRVLTISFRDPDGREVMLRRIALGRYRPYDLAQTISLSTLESLVAVLDPVKFPGLAPPERLLPSSAPATRPASLPREKRSMPALLPTQPPGPSPWALGLEVAGGVAVPGDAWLGGLGLNARLRGRRWMVQLAFDVWTPVSASGAGYDLEVQLWTLYLGGGIRHRVDRWIFGVTAGAALQIAAEDRRGGRVVAGSALRFAGGFGARLQLAWALSRALQIEAFFSLLNVFPRPSYTLNGAPVLEVGGTMAGGGLGVVLSF